MMMESVKYNTSSVKVRKSYLFQSLVLADPFCDPLYKLYRRFLAFHFLLLFKLARLAIKLDAEDFCFQRKYLARISYLRKNKRRILINFVQKYFKKRNIYGHREISYFGS